MNGSFYATKANNYDRFLIANGSCDIYNLDTLSTLSVDTDNGYEWQIVNLTNIIMNEFNDTELEIAANATATTSASQCSGMTHAVHTKCCSKYIDLRIMLCNII